MAAPVAGALADRGKTRLTTLVAHAMLVLGFLAAGAAVAALSVIAFTVTALLIDAAVQLNQITSQKIVLGISTEARSRINSIYLTAMFLIGASGSLIGSASFAAGGWSFTAAIGAGIGALSLAVFVLWDNSEENGRGAEQISGTK